MRRLYVSLLAAALIAPLALTVNSSAESKLEIPKMSSIEQLQADALQQYAIVEAKLKMHNLEDSYGGVFIDSNGELNINLTGNVDTIQALIQQDGIQYHQVQHSIKKLEETISKLEGRMLELDIVQLSLDDEKNKVVVYVRDMDENKIKRINQYIDPETVKYENAVGEIRVQ
ncbi:hypothetical protein J40TS1_41590 [Paenibacillus montaniterrae]|uniref:PepSY domain-containing protein n=1 Tax=Paenibacillus montaniterrae TaxID=429341 RepID=A0A920CVT2_9BACL|nr:hypothetical protein [Paenibacillus montaniterrae]GIP18517.1 hypothetical protein J40TS1_41590 [Paenibacillus montaniterrae]